MVLGGMIFVPSTIFYLICFYCRLIIDQMNQSLKRMVGQEKLLIISKKRIKKFIAQQDEICNKINDYNYFCCKYFFFNIITLIPASLFSIQLLIFPHSIIWRMMIACVLCSSWTFIFFVSFHTASVNKEIHKSHKELSQLIWIFQDTKVKIKVRKDNILNDVLSNINQYFLVHS
jgi:hypothetical protein